jgi:hypothetical protein
MNDSPGVAAVWRVCIRVGLLDLIIPGSWVRAPPAPLSANIVACVPVHKPEQPRTKVLQLSALGAGEG